MRIIIALLAGALLPLAFAPIGFYPLAIVAPLLLLAIWFQVAPRQAFYQGFVFGLGFFGIGASWVYVSIHEFGNTAAPLAIIFTTLFVAVLALFPAIQGWLFAKIYPKPSLAKALLAFPALWTLMEWVRSWILSGFPWLLLGASQVTSPLRGFAPIIGEYGISLIVAFSSAL
jgi:apolipoprotein N-acyltransferase